MSKYIFVTGGVCSSLGKGLASASIGALMEMHHYSVCMVKIDPYLNVDAGTMNPYQHGEVYITDDGAETDLDLGHYFRFTTSPLSRKNSITTGLVYQEIINDERKGKYLGSTVQIIPHLTDRIKLKIAQASEETAADITIIEIGGTVGDIESFPFLETARQLIQEKGWDNVLSIHLILVPELANGELKTKPGQHSVRELRETGIHPDILLCRTDYEMSDAIRKKIALFTSVPLQAVISAHNIKQSFYEIPSMYKEQQLDNIILKRLQLNKAAAQEPDNWKGIVNIIRNSKKKVTVGLLGKYTDQNDTYLSVEEALRHGAVANESTIEIVKLEATHFSNTQNIDTMLNNVDAVLLPGGFGIRGIEGMLNAIRFIRNQKLPLLSICLGMQIMIIEFARNVLSLTDANSTEFDSDCAHPVVSLLEEQQDIKNYGATMRLGSSSINLNTGSKTYSVYKQNTIHERHRHRYEVTNTYRKQLSEAGLIIAGTSSEHDLIEIVEWKHHPWGIGVQFHPEVKSKPSAAHPLFTAFIAASLEKKRFHGV